MWVFTTRGFYSVVQHRDHPNQVLVRTRNEEDIRNLKDLIDAEPYPLDHSDYEWRLDCSIGEWTAALTQMAIEIDYPNFKSAVLKRQGFKRESIYMRIWSALMDLERKGRTRIWGSGDTGYYSGEYHRSRSSRLFDSDLDNPADPRQSCDCWMDSDQGTWEEHDEECPYAIERMLEEGVDPEDPYGQNIEDDSDRSMEDWQARPDEVQRGKRGSKR